MKVDRNLSSQHAGAVLQPHRYLLRAEREAEDEAPVLLLDKNLSQKPNQLLHDFCPILLVVLLRLDDRDDLQPRRLVLAG